MIEVSVLPMMADGSGPVSISLKLGEDCFRLIVGSLREVTVQKNGIARINPLMDDPQTNCERVADALRKFFEPTQPPEPVISHERFLQVCGTFQPDPRSLSAEAFGRFARAWHQPRVVPEGYDPAAWLRGWDQCDQEKKEPQDD